MIYNIIAVIFLIDALVGALISFTKLGDDTIEKNPFIKRYLPLTKGWSLLYLLLAGYIGFLTFVK